MYISPCSFIFVCLTQPDSNIAITAEIPKYVLGPLNIVLESKQVENEKHCCM